MYFVIIIWLSLNLIDSAGNEGREGNP